MKTIRVVLGLVFFALCLPGNVRCATDANVALPGYTPLHLAALRGDANEVDALLAQGAEVDAVNAAGATPLHYATGKEWIVAALLAKGAKPDVVSKLGITPLQTAVLRTNSFPVVRRLVDAGADINRAPRVLPGTFAPPGILAAAAGNGDARTLELLLEHGAELNPVAGGLPLTFAALTGDRATTQRLLDRGAKPNHRAGAVETPLVAAVRAGRYEVAALLIESGADVSLPFARRSYTTPLMVLSAYNDVDDPRLARLLVARGADVNATNDYGETALNYALKRGDDGNLVKFLRAAGGRAQPTPVAREKNIPNRPIPAEPDARVALVRTAVQRSIDRLQSNGEAFLENPFVRDQAKCTSCHHQALPALAFDLASARGFRVDENKLAHQLHAIAAELSPQAEAARQMLEPAPNARLTLGFDLEALHAYRYPADAMTDAMTAHLLDRQREDGSWNTSVRRPPIEDGPLVGTAWSARALQLYPPAGRTEETARALECARAWLAAQKPTTPNEQVFQLIGLAWSNETTERMRPFAERLIAAQRPDGGWAQLPRLPSDAWASGSALVALHRAGIASTHVAYQRGVEFLLRTQFDNGSWWVQSRSQPTQPHFDAQFPHGKDQWISAAGTAWATLALLHTLEPTLPRPKAADAPQLIAAFAKAPAPSGRSESAGFSPASGAAGVDFAHEIKPLFERSCTGCHDGTKPRGGFALVSRDALLKGGQSGEPAIVPGQADRSHLLHFVSDQVEDMEMPPLARREKYPALSREEIARLRAWIDSGALWSNPASP